MPSLKTGADFKYRGPGNEAEEESGNKENEMAAKFKSGMGKEVKAHHILVLLLRLRQVKWIHLTNDFQGF